MSHPTEPATPVVHPFTQPPDRRTLLEYWFGWVLLGLSTVALAVPIVGYLLSPLLRRKQEAWVKLGAVDDFPRGETRIKDFANPDRTKLDGVTGRTAVYVRRVGPNEDGDFQVFAVNCAHLGCPVSWFPQAGLFMCPCHGGVYYKDGKRASGPPPRDLFKYSHRVENGQLEIWAGHLPTMYDDLREPPQPQVGGKRS